MVTALSGQAPAAEFSGEHHGIGAFEHGRRNVGHLGASRYRLMDHRFQHLGRDDDGPAGLAGSAGDLLLPARHLFDRQFDAEVATRDHDAVGELQNLVELGESGRLFDLGHHAGTPTHELAGLGDIIGPLNEGQGDPIHTDAGGKLEIAAILRGQGGHADDGVGKIEALARGEYAAIDNLGHDGRLRLLQHAHSDTAVVEQQTVAGLYGFEDLAMGKIDTALITGLGIVVEDENVTGIDANFLVAERADTQLRALQIDENADRPFLTGLDGTNDVAVLFEQIMRGMAHVDAKHVRAGNEQIFDLLKSGGGGSERSNDLNAAVSPH